MIRKQTTEHRHCDYCGTKVGPPDLDYAINDGVDRRSYVTVFSKDLCHQCASRILEEVYWDISKEDFDEIFVKLSEESVSYTPVVMPLFHNHTGNH